MDIEEIKNLQVGNLIKVAGQDARVTCISIETAPDTDEEIMVFQGDYLFTQNLQGMVPGWVFTTSEEVNQRERFMSLDNISGIEIERLEDEHPSEGWIWVHTWQNHYHETHRFKFQWKLKD